MQVTLVLPQGMKRFVRELSRRLDENTATGFRDADDLAGREWAPRLSTHGLLGIEQLVCETIAIRELTKDVLQRLDRGLRALIDQLAEEPGSQMRDRVSWTCEESAATLALR